MNRRAFLKSSLAATLLPFAGQKYTFAAEDIGDAPTIVTVFLKGGCDGLNILPPYAEDEYYKLRPTMAVPRPNISSESCLDLNGFFGFHPAAKPMWDLYQTGDLAIFPAVHYNLAPGSHFESQHFIESGVIGFESDGWLNRYLATSQGAEGAMRAMSFDPMLLHPLKGDVVVSAFSDLRSFRFNLSSEKEEQLFQHLSTAYKAIPLVKREYGDLAHATGERMLTDWHKVRGSISDYYSPENGADYPSTPFGLRLSQIAQLIKNKAGLEAAAIDIWDWDSHAYQYVRFPSLVDELATGLKAIYTDLGNDMDNVIILVMTEFGRTVAENGSQGTDHGKGAAWFALGDKVNGGVYGDWPTLNQDKLVAGRDLAHTLDFRSIYSEILHKHLRPSDINRVVPDFTYNSIGFLS